MRVLNAVSANMAPAGAEGFIYLRPVTAEEAGRMARVALDTEGLESCVGHADTAAVFTSVLGVDVPANRVSVTLTGQMDLLGQYKGPRLPEGATALPEGASISWYLVSWAEKVTREVADERLREAHAKAVAEAAELRRELEAIRSAGAGVGAKYSYQTGSGIHTPGTPME